MGAKTKEELENTETFSFSFLGVWEKKKKKKGLRARLASILLKEVDLLPRLSSKEFFFKSCSPCKSYFVQSRDAIPRTLLVYADVEKKTSFPFSDANCENWEESYCWGILGSPGEFVVQPRSFCRIEIVFPFLGPT